MDVSRSSRIVVAGLFLAMLPSLCFAQARRSGYDPAAQAQSSRQKEGFVDFASTVEVKSSQLVRAFLGLQTAICEQFSAMK